MDKSRWVVDNAVDLWTTLRTNPARAGDEWVAGWGNAVDGSGQGGDSEGAYGRVIQAGVGLWETFPHPVPARKGRLAGVSPTYPHIPSPYVNNGIFSLLRDSSRKRT